MLVTLRSLLSKIRKVSIIVFVLFAISQVFLYAIQRDRTPLISSEEFINANTEQINNVLTNPELANTKEEKQLLGVYRVSICVLIGEACTDNPNDSKVNFESSVFGYISKAVIYPFANPPSSGTIYVSNALKESGFVPKSYAAEGIGYSAMKPLVEIWKLFRNIAFAFTSILIVLIGFLIMFRFKINPQTVVTAENALPRIVLTTLLITFSFAIGGLMIDLMYVVSTVIGSILMNSTTVPEIDINNIVFRGGAMRLFNDVVINGDSWGIGEHLLSMMPNVINVLVRLLIGVWVPVLVGKHTPLGNQILNGQVGGATPGLGAIIGSIAWIAGAMIVGIFLPFLLSLIIITFCALFLFLRILILLFSAYLRIVMNILFSPLILLTGIMPGKNAFGKWIRVLAADLAVFPVVMSLIIISNIIVRVPSDSNLWQPPFLYGGLKTDPLKVLIGIGLLFMIPDLVRSVREYMGVKGSPFKFGLGVFFGGITAVASGGLGTLGQFGSISHGISGLSQLGGKIKKKMGS